MLRGMKLATRPLADGWARRRLLMATVAAQSDPAVQALCSFLAQPSQKTKRASPKR
jgi:hypothetical protein